MSKQNIQKLNKLISKVISLLDQDICEITEEEIKNRKNISSILSRLVITIIQLNKLEDNNDLSKETLGKKDLDILEDFLKRNRK